MAEINLQGTKFSFSILPLKIFAEDTYAKVEIVLENEYVSYKKTEKISLGINSLFAYNQQVEEEGRKKKQKREGERE